MIAVIGAIIAGATLDFEHHGMAVVGRGARRLAVAGTPGLSREGFLPSTSHCSVLLRHPSAKRGYVAAYALRYNEHSDEDADLIGLTAFVSLR